LEFVEEEEGEGVVVEEEEEEEEEEERREAECRNVVLCGGSRLRGGKICRGHVGLKKGGTHVPPPHMGVGEVALRCLLVEEEEEEEGEEEEEEEEGKERTRLSRL